MKKKMIVVSLLVVLTILLAACNFPFVVDEPESVENAVAETVAALEEQEVEVPTLPVQPTYTPQPTLTPVVVETVAPEPTATTLPCNSAYFVEETIPDNTAFSAGETFQKSWKLRNVGYCTWSSGYKIAFDEGNQMSGPDSQTISVEVEPNEEVTITLDLTAPASADTYRGYWMFQNADGFDIGPVWVQIVVE